MAGADMNNRDAALQNMEISVANKMNTDKPPGYSRGKAAWKASGGLPPGLARRVARKTQKVNDRATRRGLTVPMNNDMPGRAI